SHASASARSSGSLISSTTRGFPCRAVASVRSILAAKRVRTAPGRDVLIRRVACQESTSGDGLMLKVCCDVRVDLGGRCYIIGVLNAPEVPVGHGAEEE